MNNNIFITFNSESQAEQSTALRLQTISNLYGLNVVLPYRLGNSNSPSSETRSRIDKCSFVTAFCVNGVSELLKLELNYAIQKEKPLIIIYDSSKGRQKVFDGKVNVNVKECFVDFNKTDEAFHEIAVFLRENVKVGQSSKKFNQSENSLGIALIAIGLGLLAAWTLSEEKK